jgi:hypothetical protein
MSATDLTERSERAGNVHIEQETCMALLDIDAKTAADFLAPFTWQKRGRWFDGIIVDGLIVMEKLITALDLPEPERPVFMRISLSGMRVQIATILKHLDQIAPLPSDEEAMRIFRASSDPERVATAVRHWGSDERERQALRVRLGNCDLAKSQHRCGMGTRTI